MTTGSSGARTRAAVWMLLTTALLLIAGPAIGPVRASTDSCAGDGPAPYLHTCGAQIVDAGGMPVRLRALNWYGFDSNDFVAGGLRYQSYQAIVDRIKGLGFNALRIPFSNELVERDPVVSTLGPVCVRLTCLPQSGSNLLGPNSGLYGLDALSILKAIVDYAGQQGLYVILDDHRSDAAWGPQENGLWYTAATCSAKATPYTCYTPQSWLADWATLGHLFANDPYVTGMDLRNEPHWVDWSLPAPGRWQPTDCASYVRFAHWGPCAGQNNDATDWAQAATAAGNMLLSINAHWLIFVEGGSTYLQADGSYSTDGWGENLQGVTVAPIVLNVANRLVYSPHDYRWEQTNGDTTTMYASWTRNFGFIAVPGQPYTAPLWVGEFGTCTHDNTCVQDGAGGNEAGWWFSTFIDYLNNGDPTAGVPGDMSWSYWPVNGTYSDAWSDEGAPAQQHWRTCYGQREDYGVLGSDWSTLSAPLLQSLLFEPDDTPTVTTPPLTPTPPVMPSVTVTETPPLTGTPTLTPTASLTTTPTATPTATPSGTSPATPTATPSVTPSSTPIVSPTIVISLTPPVTVVDTPTGVPPLTTTVVTPTVTSLVTATTVVTPITADGAPAVNAPGLGGAHTPTLTALPTVTPTSPAPRTATAIPSSSPSATAAVTTAPSPTPATMATTSAPALTPTPPEQFSPTPSAVTTLTGTVSATATLATITAILSPTLTPPAAPTASPTPAPTETAPPPSQWPTFTCPAFTITVTPGPTATPTVIPTARPTATPTSLPKLQHVKTLHLPLKRRASKRRTQPAPPLVVARGWAMRKRLWLDLSVSRDTYGHLRGWLHYDDHHTGLQLHQTALQAVTTSCGRTRTATVTARLSGGKKSYNATLLLGIDSHRHARFTLRLTPVQPRTTAAIHRPQARRTPTPRAPSARGGAHQTRMAQHQSGTATRAGHATRSRPRRAGTVQAQPSRHGRAARRPPTKQSRSKTRAHVPRPFYALSAALGSSATIVCVPSPPPHRATSKVSHRPAARRTPAHAPSRHTPAHAAPRRSTSRRPASR